MEKIKTPLIDAAPHPGKPGRVFRLEGQQFGELKVLKRDGFTRHGYLQWRCVCTCGQQVSVGGDNLRRGYKKACGVNGHRFSAGKATIFSPVTRPLNLGLTTRYKSEYQSWIDMNVNYQPGNCKWIDRKDQSRNKRNSVHVVYQGKKMLLVDLVEGIGLSSGTVKYRIKAG